jgi:hypothetical protein
VGQHAALADLYNDWEFTHEMVHFSFPSVEDRHHWIEEESNSTARWLRSQLRCTCLVGSRNLAYTATAKGRAGRSGALGSNPL